MTIPTADPMPKPSSAAAIVCVGCSRALEGTLYEMRSRAGRVVRCLRCALFYPPLMARSLTICLVVGTLLTAINQGNVIIQGEFPLALAWKIPLTYAMPYLVATLGAVLHARSAAPEPVSR